MTGVMIHIVLAGAVVLVVPLALRLDARRPLAPDHFTLALAAGQAGALSLLFDRGWTAAAFASVWLLAVTLLAVRHVLPLDLRRLVRAAPEVVPFGYLVVGAGWLVVSRYGGRPLGFDGTIVELTAVHFHYAGFVAPIVILRLIRGLASGDRSAAAARAALVAVLVATPLTAAGITFEPALGAAGAALFAAGLTVSSVLTLGRVFPHARGASRILLGVSSVSVIAAMALAVAYGFGQWLGTPAPSLPAMVRTHGVLNSAGFALCGVLGWMTEQRGGARPADGR